MRNSLLSAVVCVWCVACVGDPAYQSRSADEWATLLNTGGTRERALAADAFTHAPPHTFPNVRALLVAADDPEPAVRAAVLTAIRRLATSATKALVRALSDTNTEVRRHAATALGGLSDGAPQSVPALIAATRDPDDSVRTSSVLSLGRLGPVAYDAVPRVRELATEPGPQRVVALIALPEVDIESRSLLPVYREALHDTSAAVRAVAATLLPAGAREMSIDLVPLLTPALADRDARVQLAALRTLAWVGRRDSTALPAIAALRNSSDTTVRRVADSVFDVLHRPRPTGRARGKP